MLVRKMAPVSPMLIRKKVLRSQEPLGVMCIATGALGTQSIRRAGIGISVDLEKASALGSPEGIMLGYLAVAFRHPTGSWAAVMPDFIGITGRGSDASTASQKAKAGARAMLGVR
jgi:hypothetical protein